MEELKELLRIYQTLGAVQPGHETLHRDFSLYHLQEMFPIRTLEGSVATEVVFSAAAVWPRAIARGFYEGLFP